MGVLQDQHERAVGEDFFEWFNERYWSGFSFLRRGGEAPDLVYGWQGLELGVEVTGAYYDAKHGEFLWKGARQAPDAPNSWFGAWPHQSMVQAVVECIRAKSAKQYGSNALLLVNIPPGVTSAEELAHRLEREELPRVNVFEGVYVCGTFPRTLTSSGGYRVIPVKEVS